MIPARVSLLAPVPMNSAPGYLWGLGYYLAATAFSMAGPSVRPKAFRWMVCLGIMGCATLFLFVSGDDNVLWYIPRMSLALLCVYFIFVLTSGYSGLNCIFFTLNAFILGETITAFSWQIYLYLAAHDINEGTAPAMACFAVVSVPVIVFIFFRERTLFSPKKPQQILEGRELFPVVLVTISVFLFSNLSNYFRDTPFSGQTSFQVNLIHLLVDISGLFLLDAWRIFRISLARRTENEALRSIMETQYVNYQLSEQSMELIHQKYHDLKHQIAYFRSNSPGKEKNEYLDRMEQDISAFEAIGHTGNHVLDTILTARTLQCMRKNIKITGVVNGRLLDFISPPDMSALMGNLLDNAIESTEAIDDTEKRWIQFSVTERKGFVLIEVGNHYVGEVVFDDGLPVTTKKDDRYHGYGTRSIRMIAASYGGTVSYQAEDGWFQTKVLFPKA